MFVFVASTFVSICGVSVYFLLLSQKMEPGHTSFVFVASTFVSICGVLAYFLLTLPVYYYALIGFVWFFVQKYFHKKDSKNADFINDSGICVVGAGFSGLCMGVKLKKAGFKFRILEKGSGVGGTWTANQYPGCRCDVWSVLYQV